MKKRIILPTILFFASTALMQAHPSAEHASTLLTGLTHPFSGLDHLLAMVAVGLWAAQSRDRQYYALPVAFVLAMIVGALTGVAGIALPYAEHGILLSLIGLGCMIALAVRPRTIVAMLVTGSFGFIHGYAHGIEIPQSAAWLPYCSGMVLSTVVLHLTGIAVSLAAIRFNKSYAIRFAGVAMLVAVVLMG